MADQQTNKDTCEHGAPLEWADACPGCGRSAHERCWRAASPEAIAAIKADQTSPRE